jgi:hypothetical protein
VIRCASCFAVIEREQDAWWEITGWEKSRKQGGTNAVFDRKRTGTAICEDCHLRRKFGGSLGQGDLFDAGT